MNHNNQDLIWKYLDKQCTLEEIEKVESLIATDKRFREELERNTALHQVIQSTTVQRAPLNLKTQVLAQLNAQKSTRDYQGIGIGPLIVFVSILTLVIFNLNRQVGLSGYWMENVLDTHLPNFIPSIEWSLPSLGLTGFYVAGILIAIPLLYFMDQYFSKGKVANRNLLFLTW